MECAICGVAVTQTRYGPVRRYCSGRCRMRAHRIRLASTPPLPEIPDPPPGARVVWPPPPQLTGPYPDRSAVLPEAAAPLERLAAGVEALREVRTSMRQLAGSRSLSPPLSQRAERTADHVEICLGEVWGIGERKTD